MLDTRVVYLEPGKLSVETMRLPPLKPNQVLIKAHQASVCGSERYFYRGITVRPEDEAKGGPEVQLGAGKADTREHAYPMGPLGHEGGGTIVEIGSGVDEYIGGGKVKVGGHCRADARPGDGGVDGGLQRRQHRAVAAVALCRARPPRRPPRIEAAAASVVLGRARQFHVLAGRERLVRADGGD